MLLATLRHQDRQRAFSLTAREKEILSLFAAGMGTAALAQRLEISPVTVRNHAQRILAKLGAHSRLEAVARAYALGVITPNILANANMSLPA